MAAVYKCPVCGQKLVQEYGCPILGTNFRIKHYDKIRHAMLYRTPMDSDYESYNASSALRPYKDGKVYREEHGISGGYTGRMIWASIK